MPKHRFGLVPFVMEVAPQVGPASSLPQAGYTIRLRSIELGIWGTQFPAALPEPGFDTASAASLQSRPHLSRVQDAENCHCAFGFRVDHQIVRSDDHLARAFHPPGPVRPRVIAQPTHFRLDLVQ